MHEPDNFTAFVAKSDYKMTVSEVIEALTRLRNRFGELPVNFEKASGIEGGIWTIAAYDANGCDEGEMVEIFIH